jgi:hypothetical protein
MLVLYYGELCVVMEKVGQLRTCYIHVCQCSVELEVWSTTVF